MKKVFLAAILIFLLFLLVPGCTRIGSWDLMRDIALHGGLGREITLQINLDALFAGAPAVPGSADIAAFPFLVRIDFSDPLISHGQYLNLSDIRFFADTGDLLPHETVHFDSGGASAFWVRIPNLDELAATNTIYLRYDYWARNPPSVPASSEVWSNGFVAVWHLDEDDPVSVYRDASGNGNDGAPTDGFPELVDMSDTVLGVGRARDFAPASDSNGTLELAALAGSDLTTLTFSCWLKAPDDLATNAETFEGMDLLTLNDMRIAATGTQLRFWVFTDLTDQLAAHNHVDWYGGTYNPAPWRHIAVLHSGDHTETPGDGAWNVGMKVFRDGVQVGNIANNTPGIGSRGGNAGLTLDVGEGAHPFQQPISLDEIRLSNVQRSPDWTKLEYGNMAGLVNATIISDLPY